MPRNPGHLPDECVITDDLGNVTGYRAVHVWLFSGYDTQKAGAAPWPAKGGRPHETNWRISGAGHRFEIESYEVV